MVQLLPAPCEPRLKYCTLHIEVNPANIALSLYLLQHLYQLEGTLNAASIFFVYHFSASSYRRAK